MSKIINNEKDSNFIIDTEDPQLMYSYDNRNGQFNNNFELTELFHYIKDNYTGIKKSSSITPDTLVIINKDDKEVNKKKYFNIKKQIKIPQLFLEERINSKIKIMNIDKEMKIKFLLDSDNNNNKIINTKNELNVNFKRRRKSIKGLSEQTKKQKKEKNYKAYRNDNMINRIKNMIHNSLIISINRLIKSLQIDKDIKKINYNLRVNKRKKNDNLELLNFTIKDYLSKDISAKYNHNKYQNNYNDIVIDNLLLDNNNKDIFEFIFNHLKLEDWLDLFTYKKDLTDFDECNSLDKIKRSVIKDNLVRIDKYLDKIYKEDKIYFHIFCILIYNLRLYLTVGRNRRKGKEKVD